MIEMNLEELRTVVPDLTLAWAEERLGAAVFCLDHNGHTSSVKMETADGGDNINLSWNLVVDDRLKNSNADTQVATEIGAEGVAALMAFRMTDYKVIRRSQKGTGFDYWLGYKVTPDSALLFQESARLEVSGLLKGNDNQYQQRIKKKSQQPARSNHTKLPAYVSVTDFGKPRTTFVKV